MLLINFGDDKDKAAVIDKLKSSAIRYLVKSKTVASGEIEMTIELRIKEGEMGCHGVRLSGTLAKQSARKSDPMASLHRGE